jgi:hypothetical protein
MRKSIPVYFVFIFLSLPLLRAQEPIPNSKGWNGYVRLGVGYLHFRNNQVAQFMSYRLNETQIESIDEVPTPQNTALLTFPLEIGYTFVPYKTHIFIGNQIEDLIRFDVTQQLGFKQRLWSFGTLHTGLLYTGLPTKVWEDPFLTNAERTATARTAFGYLVALDQIGGSGFRVQYAYRDVRLKTERSGASLNLVSEDQALLDRNGAMHSVKIWYRFFFQQKHRVSPELELISDKRKGEARSRTNYHLAVNYIRNFKKLMFISNARIGWSTYDAVHPVYGVKQFDRKYGLTISTFVANPWNYKLFGDKPWRFVFTAGYNYVDANIEFYQQRGLLLQTGLFTRW